MKLYNSFRNLILEMASSEELIDAIRNKNVLVIYYLGDKPGGEGFREIEPVCFGVSKAGNKVLRAWEREGASHRTFLGTRPMPGWRYFRLDKITTISLTGEKFDTPRPNYNPNGDKSMVSVEINANFNV
jgi:predicted DNA-binding transcriptional regulator YafY